VETADNSVLSYNKKKNELAVTSNISKEDFCRNVLKAKQYIRDGDIFQVVLSQRLCVETNEILLTYTAP